MITILPEWKSRPDSVLYSWAGAKSAFSGKSWIASTNVDDFLRNRGELATISAVLNHVRFNRLVQLKRGYAKGRGYVSRLDQG